MRRFNQFSVWIAAKVNFVACITLVLMMLLTCADVVGRLLGHPVPGAYDLMGFLAAATIAFALAQTTVNRGHISVELVVRRLPLSVQKTIFALVQLFGLTLFCLLAYESFIYGAEMKRAGEGSLTIQLPLYPILYGLGFSALLTCLILVADTVQGLSQPKSPWSNLSTDELTKQL